MRAKANDRSGSLGNRPDSRRSCRARCLSVQFVAIADKRIGKGPCALKKGRRLTASRPEKVKELKERPQRDQAGSDHRGTGPPRDEATGGKTLRQLGPSDEAAREDRVRRNNRSNLTDLRGRLRKRCCWGGPSSRFGSSTTTRDEQDYGSPSGTRAGTQAERPRGLEGDSFPENESDGG